MREPRAYLVVVHRVDQQHQASGGILLPQRQRGDVGDHERVELLAEPQVVGGTARLWGKTPKGYTVGC